MQVRFFSSYFLAIPLWIGLSLPASAAEDCLERFTCTGQASAPPARSASPAPATTPRITSNWPVLTFQGLVNLENILDYYAGGIGSEGSGPGPNYGMTFSDNALAVISEEAGGTGNFTNNPSGDTTMGFVAGDTATLNVPDGFQVGFSFYYSAAFNAGEVIVYDGINATGNILATLSLPITPPTGQTPFDFDNWQAVGVEFDGTARSVDFGGATDGIGFDNITVGQDDPDTIFRDRFEPE